MTKSTMEGIRKLQVIKATEKCILEKGFSNMSIKSIASAANLSTGVIYYYFQNKEDLLLQVLKESFRQSHEQVMRVVQPIRDPMSKLSRHIDHINAVPRDNPNFYTLFLSFLGEAKHNSDIRRIISHFFRNLRTYIESYLVRPENRQFNDVIPDNKIDLLPVMIIGLGLGIGIQWIVDEEAFDLNRATERFKQLFFAYLERPFGQTGEGAPDCVE